MQEILKQLKEMEQKYEDLHNNVMNKMVELNERVEKLETFSKGKINVRISNVRKSLGSTELFTRETSIIPETPLSIEIREEFIPFKLTLGQNDKSKKLENLLKLANKVSDSFSIQDKLYVENVVLFCNEIMVNF